MLRREVFSVVVTAILKACAWQTTHESRNLHKLMALCFCPESRPEDEQVLLASGIVYRQDHGRFLGWLTVIIICLVWLQLLRFRCSFVDRFIARASRRARS